MQLADAETLLTQLREAASAPTDATALMAAPASGDADVDSVATEDRPLTVPGQ